MRAAGRAVIIAIAIAAAAPVGCAGGDRPRASASATSPIVLESNEVATFYVDGKAVGTGKRVEVLVSGEAHRIIVKSAGFIGKEEIVRPPYGERWSRRFLFLLEDRERAGASASGTAKSTGPTRPAAAGVPRIWTLAIGVSRYKDTALSLRYADRDAIAIDAFFASAAGGAVPKERRALLVNEQATRAAVLTALTNTAKRTAPDDLLVLFLAAHGLPDGAGDLYFLSHDADVKQLVGTGLPQRDLEYALAKASARRVVLLLDACHAGAAGASGVAGKRGLELAETNRLLGRLAETRPGTAVLTAATASESSLEDSKWGGGHGAFSHYTLLGLGGDADRNQDRFVTVRELYDFVYRKVSEDTEGQQHPELKGTFDNAMPLAGIP